MPLWCGDMPRWCGASVAASSNHHDAEDAFQATFLVLVRKAADVPRQAVANWLYGVARQTAVRVRATAAKRGRRETQVVNMPEPTVPEVRDADLQAVLDEELSRLPDHYRGVVVLCDLEGMTRKEAARQLGIPEGSVASRLARARVMLAKRLTQRGVVFSGGSVAAVLSAGRRRRPRPLWWRPRSRPQACWRQGRRRAASRQSRRPHRRSGESHVRDQDQGHAGGRGWSSGSTPHPFPRLLASLRISSRKAVSKAAASRLQAMLDLLR